MRWKAIRSSSPKAQGAYLTDVDGKSYVDYVGSWGPMIVGHAHPAVVKAVQDAMLRGSSYGAPTAGEVELAEQIRDAYPTMQMLRMTSSGTEAVMGALRVARGFTKRDLVVKFEGAYHGGADYLLVKAGSGLATFGEPDSAGVPAAIAGTTSVLPWNDEAACRALFEKRGKRDRCADSRAGRRQHGLRAAGARASSSFCASSRNSMAHCSCSTK